MTDYEHGLNNFPPVGELPPNLPEKINHFYDQVDYLNTLHEPDGFVHLQVVDRALRGSARAIKTPGMNEVAHYDKRMSYWKAAVDEASATMPAVYREMYGLGTANAAFKVHPSLKHTLDSPIHASELLYSGRPHKESPMYYMGDATIRLYDLVDVRSVTLTNRQTSQDKSWKLIRVSSDYFLDVRIEDEDKTPLWIDKPLKPLENQVAEFDEALTALNGIVRAEEYFHGGWK